MMLIAHYQVNIHRHSDIKRLPLVLSHFFMSLIMSLFMFAESIILFLYLIGIGLF